MNSPYINAPETGRIEIAGDDVEVWVRDIRVLQMTLSLAQRKELAMKLWPAFGRK